MWPISLKYQQCPKVKLPRSKIWDSFTWSGFPQGYSPDFIKASLPKYKWTLTNVSWTWNYTGSLIQPTFSFSSYQSPTYHSHSVPTIPSHHSHKKFSTAILDCTTTILRLSTINRRAGFIKNSSRKKNTLNHEMKICFFQIFKSSFSQPFLIMALSFSTLSN